MTERKQGHSKLVYDKATRTIKTIDPHPESNPLCPRCQATVLSTSQPERMGTITDEMLNLHLKATGEWIEPHEAQLELGVPIECDLTQEDADNINADQRDNLRIGYTAALAATPAVGVERAYAAAIANLREAWAALAMIREAIETLAPCGSVKASEHLDGPTFTHEADALVAGIMALAAPPASPLRGRELSENERHAVAHARYQVEHASPDNPNCCFDYELVQTLLSLIASPPEQPAAGCGDPSCKDPDCTYGEGTNYLDKDQDSSALMPPRTET